PVAPCCARLRTVEKAPAKLFIRLDHNTSPHYSRRRCALERKAGQLSRFLTTAGAPAEQFDIKKSSVTPDFTSARCASVSALRSAQYRTFNIEHRTLNGMVWTLDVQCSAHVPQAVLAPQTLVILSVPAKDLALS